MTIEYLTIQNFVPPGAQAPSTSTANPVDPRILHGAGHPPRRGRWLGTNAVITADCLTENGEYGFNGYSTTTRSLTGGPTNVTMTATRSPTTTPATGRRDPFPITPPSGCHGVGVRRVRVFRRREIRGEQHRRYEDNYVHDNYSTGAWWGNDNTGWNIQGNYIAEN